MFIYPLMKLFGDLPKAKKENACFQKAVMSGRGEEMLQEKGHGNGATATPPAPAASPKALSPGPTTPAPHHRPELDTWTGGCQRPWRGCRPHVPAESPHTLLTRLFCSERSTGKSQTGQEKGGNQQGRKSRSELCSQDVNLQPLTTPCPANMIQHRGR